MKSTTNHLKEDVPIVGPGEIGKSPIEFPSFELNLNASALVIGGEESERTPIDYPIIVRIAVLIVIAGIIISYVRI